jgi:lysophospholipase L1-like esterase
MKLLRVGETATVLAVAAVIAGWSASPVWPMKTAPGVASAHLRAAEVRAGGNHPPTVHPPIVRPPIVHPPIAHAAVVEHVRPKAGTVVIYGDSLTVESENAVRLRYSQAYGRIVFRAFGGTALCDWLAQAEKDRAGLHPQRVVLAFTGNTASCVAADFLARGISGAVANYRLALTRMREIYPTEVISVTLSPAMHNQPDGWFPFNGSPALNAMYRQVGQQLHMTVNPAADDALTPGHRFSATRPGPDGRTAVVVRLSDGVHLTAAGAAIYGKALLEPTSG